MPKNDFQLQLEKLPFEFEPQFPVRPWWPWLWTLCPQRILMVCDGTLDFSTNGFGLTEVVNNVLKVYVPGYRVPTITTAHRGGGTANITNFKFDVAPPAPYKQFNFTNYDQLWLFGFQTAGSGLTSAELQAIADFMDAGGGVFATGDHEDLGAGMCGNIPRVRSMRLWFNTTQPWQPVAAPNGSNSQRIDTLTPGGDDIFTFNDQSDEHPQRIHVRYFDNTATATAFDYKPHPLMQRSDGKPILNFPDHPHEGVCVEPVALSLTYQFTGAAKAEYPSSATAQPYVVATGFSGGGYVSDSGKPAVIPRCFGIVSAYDGHLVNVGRVACDATWHHWVNINLVGTGGAGRTGFYVGGVRTPEYKDEICQYYRNLVKWLAPPRIRLCHYIIGLIDLKFDFPLIEEWRQPPELPDLPELVRMGRLVAQAGRAALQPDFEVEAASAFAMLTGKNASLPMQSMLTPWSGDKPAEKLGIVAPGEIRLALLGAAMYAVWSVTPDDTAAMGKLTEKSAAALRDKALKAVTQIVPKALDAYMRTMEQRMALTTQALNGISTLMR